ncbi:hypothetical protein [Kitasatospora sp. NBC_01539]|uniref:hypothetical protein n=1 Tax=Kitasatospora sp. NBC_01539 TaxID=2903577 RepID=UPI00386017C8
METTKTITKLTGHTVIAMPSGAVSPFGTRGSSTVAPLCGVVVVAGNGLGLDGTGVPTVSGHGFTGFGGASFETGLSRDWATFDRGLVMRDERPTQAPKAVAAAAIHGGYARVSGAGAEQDEQLINQAEAARKGAGAVRMGAFRGPKPWSERT